MRLLVGSREWVDRAGQGRAGDYAKEESKFRQSHRQRSFHQIPSGQLWKVNCVLKSGAREMGISQDGTCQPFVKSRGGRLTYPRTCGSLSMPVSKTNSINPRSDSESTPIVRGSLLTRGTKISQGTWVGL